MTALRALAERAVRHLDTARAWERLARVAAAPGMPAAVGAQCRRKAGAALAAHRRAVAALDARAVGMELAAVGAAGADARPTGGAIETCRARDGQHGTTDEGSKGR